MGLHELSERKRERGGVREKGINFININFISNVYMKANIALKTDTSKIKIIVTFHYCRILP